VREPDQRLVDQPLLSQAPVQPHKVIWVRSASRVPRYLPRCYGLTAGS
jgi:hypothetical protein